MRRGEILKVYAISAVVALVLSVTVFSFLLISIIKKNNAAGVLAAEIQLETVREAKVKSIKLTVTDNESRENLAKYLVSSEGAVDFIELIESFSSNETNVSIESVNVEPYSNDSFEWLVVGVSANGRWGEMVRLMFLLESLPIRTEAEGVSVSYNNSSGRWDLRMKIKALKEI